MTHVNLTELIQESGESETAKARLYEEVYDELRQAAQRFTRRQHPGDFQTTALVNEVLLRFETGDALRNMANRRVFFSIALRAMNQILIDHYRRRKKLVDSPNRRAEPLDHAVAVIEDQLGFDFEQLQSALEKLSNESPRQHQVILHRFFGGLSIKDTAELLDVSDGTVERDWRLARAKLFRDLQD